jgi:hypothetical protein
MEIKLEHEFEMIYFKLVETRRGCMGIPKLVVLLVLFLSSFLIISCLTSQTKKYSHLHDTPMPIKWLVLQNR